MVFDKSLAFITVYLQTSTHQDKTPNSQTIIMSIQDLDLFFDVHGERIFNEIYVDDLSDFHTRLVVAKVIQAEYELNIHEHRQALETLYSIPSFLLNHRRRKAIIFAKTSHVCRKIFANGQEQYESECEIMLLLAIAFLKDSLRAMPHQARMVELMVLRIQYRVQFGALPLGY